MVFCAHRVFLFGEYKLKKKYRKNIFIQRYQSRITRKKYTSLGILIGWYQTKIYKPVTASRETVALLFYGPLAKKYEGNVGGAVNVCFLWTYALSNEKLFHRTEKLYRQVRGYVLASFSEFRQSRQTKWKRISNGINDDPLLFDARILPFFLSRRIVTVVNEDEWKLRAED